jgi:hypothetical protein
MGYRGRFAMYLPPLLEHLDVVELEHKPVSSRLPPGEWSRGQVEVEVDASYVADDLAVPAGPHHRLDTPSQHTRGELSD